MTLSLSSRRSRQTTTSAGSPTGGHRDHVDQVVEIDDVDPAESENDVSGAEPALCGR